MSFLLRVEGVNLGGFIYDTQDLSTIRGGGLLLLDAATQVLAILTGTDLGCTVTPVVEGASIGIFRVRESPKSPAEVRAAVAAALSRWLPHATFVVDTLEDADETPRAHATVLARNRWRQLQAPTVVYPSLAAVTAGTECCEIDTLRPAAYTENSAPDGKRRQSAATHRRRSYGRAMKQAFYRREMARTGTPDPPDLQYTQDFEDLCGASEHWGNLRDKMAVVYLDGNGFTAIRDRCSNDAALAAFSQGLRDEQARILRALVEERIVPDPDWLNGADARLETLLWGGDEVTWAVPAWKGWELLQFFFEKVGAQVRLDWNPSPDPLTYSAGLVFCHKKAPIHTITRLAHDLVDQVKQAARSEGEDRPRTNEFLYQVLESFDHIGDVGPEYRPLILTAQAMSAFTAAMPVWRETISRKKLYQVLKAPSPARKAALAQELQAELRATAPDEADAAQAAITALGRAGDDTLWRHIGELWDYVAPERSDA